MAKPAVRESDPHTCPLHGGGPVLPPCATNVIVGGHNAARMGDLTLCPGPTDVITGGTTSTIIEAQGATREGEFTAHGGKIERGLDTVLIGKAITVRVVIVRGSCWDNPKGRADIEKQLQEAEKILGMRIASGTHETLDNAGLLTVDKGPWSGSTHYSSEIVSNFNAFSSSDRPTLLYTESLGPETNALTVGRAWAGSSDGLVGEGVVFSCSHVSSTTGHEMGHLLSGKTGIDLHSTDQNNLMWGGSDRTGTNWTDPWATAGENNPYLK